MKEAVYDMTIYFAGRKDAIPEPTAFGPHWIAWRRDDSGGIWFSSIDWMLITPYGYAVSFRQGNVQPPFDRIQSEDDPDGILNDMGYLRNGEAWKVTLEAPEYDDSPYESDADHAVGALMLEDQGILGLMHDDGENASLFELAILSAQPTCDALMCAGYHAIAKTSLHDIDRIALAYSLHTESAAEKDMHDILQRYSTMEADMAGHGRLTDAMLREWRTSYARLDRVMGLLDRGIVLQRERNARILETIILFLTVITTYQAIMDIADHVFDLIRETGHGTPDAWLCLGGMVMLFAVFVLLFIAGLRVIFRTDTGDRRREEPSAVRRIWLWPASGGRNRKAHHAVDPCNRGTRG